MRWLINNGGVIIETMIGSVFVCRVSAAGCSGLVFFFGLLHCR